MEIKAHHTTTTDIQNIKGFEIKSSGVMFDILSSKLYTNPIRAIIRELLTNAYDSHVVAGTTDKKVKVVVPSYSELDLIIRDFGVGLSESDMMSLYSTFFDSTKNTNNKLTGGFGLGSKTPFAYTDSFFVNSYFDGVLSKYVLFKNNGVPSINKISEQETTEHNGLEIVIPVHSADRNMFVRELEFFYTYNPEVLIHVVTDYPLNTTKEIYRKDKYTWYDCSNSMIKQGQNVFYMSDIERNFNERHQEALGDTLTLFRDVLKEGVVIEVPIGTLSVAPNRESLHLDNSTMDNIISTFKEYSTFVADNQEELVATGVGSILKHYLRNFKSDVLSFIGYDSDGSFGFDIKNTRQIHEDSNVSTYIRSWSFHSTYGYPKLLLGKQQTPTSVIFLLDEHDSINSYQRQKVKRSLNAMGNSRILMMERKEGTPDMVPEFEALIEYIKDIGNYNCTYEIHNLESFFTKYTPQGTDKVLTKSYRVMSVYCMNGSNHDYRTVRYSGGELMPITSLDTVGKTPKFKWLVSTTDDKEGLAHELEKNIGFNIDGNTLFKYLHLTGDLNVNQPTSDIQLIMCHKEAFNNSLLPVFDFNAYLDYTKTQIKLPEYLMSSCGLIAKIPKILEFVDFYYSKQKHKYSIIKNSNEYKTLQVLAKYGDSSQYSFPKLASSFGNNLPYLVNNAFKLFNINNLEIHHIHKVLDVKNMTKKEDRKTVYSSWYTTDLFGSMSEIYHNIVNQRSKHAYN